MDRPGQVRLGQSYLYLQIQNHAEWHTWLAGRPALDEKHVQFSSVKSAEVSLILSGMGWNESPWVILSWKYLLQTLNYSGKTVFVCFASQLGTSIDRLFCRCSLLIRINKNNPAPSDKFNEYLDWFGVDLAFIFLSHSSILYTLLSTHSNQARFVYLVSRVCLENKRLKCH